MNAIQQSTKELNSPIQRYYEIQKIHKYFLNNFNLEIYDPVVKSSARSYPFILYNIFIIVTVVYSIAMKDLDIALMSLAYLGLTCQVW